MNVSSHSGFTGLGSSMAYAASKGALNTLTLAPGPDPGAEDTRQRALPGLRRYALVRAAHDRSGLSGFKRGIEQTAPLRRMVQAEDVAEAALWFIVGGRSITGQLLVIDGGNHLNVSEPLALRRR